MVRSMTGFARAQAQGEWGSASWEVRSVNHRFLEVSWRLPEHLRELEIVLRDELQQSAHRGKFDCSLRFVPGTVIEQTITINQSLVNALNQAAHQIQLQVPDARPMTTADLLKWNGMLEIVPTDLQEVKKILLEMFRKTLNELAEMRGVEGEKLKQLIKQRITQAYPLIEQAKKSSDSDIQAQREKIVTRFEELKLSVDEQRLEQELVFLAQKQDITEELDRLTTHLNEVSRILDKSGTIGRRLDFLMQELNREANTLGSKSISTSTTQASVELKVLIEQMREQVQNIE